MKKILLIIILIVGIIQIQSWFSCHDFKETFHFSKYPVLLELDNLVHNDTGLPFVLIRFYHNKIAQSAISIFSSYLRFWDVKFLVNLLLPVGIFGLIWTFLYGLKNKILQILILFSLILPFFEILSKSSFSFPIRITLFALPLFILSLFGISLFLRKKGVFGYFLLGVLIILSIWWQAALPGEFKNYCI